VFLRVSDPEGDDYVSVVHRHRVIVHDADDVLVSVILRGTDFEVGGCCAQIQSTSPKLKNAECAHLALCQSCTNQTKKADITCAE